MKLENQVTSLELSKRLKELGVKQESAFIWTNFNDKENEWSVRFCNFKKPEHDWFAVSAFTVAELGEMLPDWFYTNGYSVFVDENKIGVNGTTSYMLVEEFPITETDARAKMLIYLLENGLLTL